MILLTLLISSIYKMLCLRFPCRPVSRVLYMTIIYLDVISLKRSSRLLRPADHGYHLSTTLLRMGFTRPVCLHTAGELLPRLFILTLAGGFLFCCTFLKVAFTGNCPAPCPVEPGLSSCAVLSYPGARDRLGLPEKHNYFINKFNQSIDDTSLL